MGAIIEYIVCDFTHSVADDCIGAKVSVELLDFSQCFIHIILTFPFLNLIFYYLVLKILKKINVIIKLLNKKGIIL